MSDDMSSALRLVIPPAVEPVSLTQAKQFLRIEHAADDVAVSSAIAAARHFAENYLRTALLPQTWEFVLANPRCSRVRLPLGPARAVVAVTRSNEAGEETVMDGGAYRLSADGFSVLFSYVPYGEQVTVRYEAGAYANEAAVPALVVQGMLHHVAVMVENRDGVAALPVQSVHCYQPFRRIGL